MTNSFSRVFNRACPICNNNFDINSWQIIDPNEHPDLLEKAFSGEIHIFSCPNGHPCVFDSPLLIFYRKSRTFLIYSPEQNTDLVNIWMSGFYLIEKLRKQMGQSWKEKWANKDVIVVHRLKLQNFFQTIEENPLHVFEKFENLPIAKPINSKDILIEMTIFKQKKDISFYKDYCKKMVEVVPVETNPFLWAMLQFELGFCYEKDKSSDQVRIQEKEIFHLNLALLILDTSNDEEKWAKIHYELGFVFSERISGSKSDNLEEAIRHFNLALLSYKIERSPEGFSAVHSVLSEVYRKRIVGDVSDNIENSILHCKLALKVIKRNKSPLKWVSTITHLANAYCLRKNGDREINLEIARSMYENSIKVLDTINLKSPQTWAIVNLNLAGLYSERIRGDRKDNFNKSITHYQKALEICNEDNFPDQWSKIHFDLGLAYKRYSNNTNIELINKAIYYWEILWHHLQHSYKTINVIEKIKQQENWSSLYFLLAFTYYELNQIDLLNSDHHRIRALEIVESYKNKFLSDLLGLKNIPVPHSIPHDLIIKENDLIKELIELDTQFYVIEGSGNKNVFFQNHNLKQRKDLLSKLDNVWHEMEKYGDEVQNYLKIRRGEPGDWVDLQKINEKVDRKTAFMSFYSKNSQILIFFWWKELKVPLIFSINIANHELEECVIDFWNSTINYPVRLKPHSQIKSKWEKLGIKLFSPIISHLANFNHLVIAPDTIFHRIPLHAMQIDLQGNTLLDYVSVSYSQAFCSLIKILNQKKSVSSQSLVLGFSDAPESSDERNIINGEAKLIAAEMTCNEYINEKATIETLRNYSKHSLKVIHISCHGRIDHNNPLDSLFKLADGEFTAREWLDLQIESDLVTLSSCDLGSISPLGGEEIAGFVQSLLISGSRSAILGLWSVNALAAKALMVDFYRRWNKGLSKAVSLQQAMIAFKNGELLISHNGINYANPYYWAPFCLYGDWL